MDHFKNTILQNFDPKRFDYFLKLFFFKLPLGTNRLIIFFYSKFYLFSIK